MRTALTGFSSTSCVLPIRSSKDGATRLSIPPPNVDRRARLPEQLVHAPDSSGRVRRDTSRSVALTQFGRTSPQPREAKQIVARVPRSVLDHALAPLAAELRGRHEGQTRVGGALLDRAGLHAFGDDRHCIEDFLRLE